MKAKAMMVEKVTEEREKAELKDLKQQIETITMIMKSTTIGTVKAKGREGIPSPRKKSYWGVHHRKECKDHLKKEKYPLDQTKKPLQCFRCKGWDHGWCESPTLENFIWRELMGAGVLLMPGGSGSAPTQIQSQNQ